MLDNVWEWVEDDYVQEIDPHGNIRYDAPRWTAARIEGAMTKFLRGGAWIEGITPYTSGCGSRYNSAPTNASNDAGFRVVLPAEQAEEQRMRK